MASLNGLPNELVFMIADHIETFDDIPDRERGLHSLALTNRRFHLMFNTALYAFDACNQRKAMAWGANPIVSTDEGRVSAMHVAAALGRNAMFDLLLSRPGCDLDAQDQTGNTPLHYAARGFFDIKCTDFNGNYPPRFTNSTSIASLVRRGACLQATNDDGESPVVFALAKHPSQWKAALQLLLLDPARFVPSDKLVTTAIAGARENVNRDKSEQWEFLRQILTSTPLNRRYRVPGSSLAFGRLHPWLSDANNSQTGVTTLLMWTILQRSAMCIDPESHHTRAMERMFVELLNMGANVGGSDDQARTPLHACIFEAMTGQHNHTFEFTGNGFREAREQFPFNLIQSLLVRSASLELRDRSGKTPLDYVLEPGSEDPATIKARATNVARLVLLQVWSVGRGFTSPSEDVKRRLVDRLGVEILAPEDPLKAKLESGGN